MAVLDPVWTPDPGVFDAVWTPLIPHCDVVKNVLPTRARAVVTAFPKPSPLTIVW